MKLFLFFLLFGLNLSAQNAFISDEVRAKMDQNKIDGVQTLSGIDFVHKVLVPLDLIGVNYTDQSVLTDALNNIKNDLGYTGVNFLYNENSELFIEFIDDQENKLDDLKIALNEKNLKPRALGVYARLK